VVVLRCTEWSDDFDPSISTKSNRQSCWIKMVTLMSCNAESVGSNWHVHRERNLRACAQVLRVNLFRFMPIWQQNCLPGVIHVWLLFLCHRSMSN